MGKTIYLSGGWADAPEVSFWAGAIEGVGFRIAHDWFLSAMDPNTKSDGDLSDAERVRIAKEEFEAVLGCDVFWLLVPSYNGSKGSWFEFGVACALAAAYEKIDEPQKVSVIVSGAWRGTIFTSLPYVKTFDAHQEAFDHIKGL